LNEATGSVFIDAILGLRGFGPTLFYYDLITEISYEIFSYDLYLPVIFPASGNTHACHARA